MFDIGATNPRYLQNFQIRPYNHDNIYYTFKTWCFNIDLVV